MQFYRYFWHRSGRSPSWGAWIEMPVDAYCSIDMKSRSPSWGAWIEMFHRFSSKSGASGRSPSWGAWIEILNSLALSADIIVAPPRGERGLKLRREE